MLGSWFHLHAGVRLMLLHFGVMVPFLYAGDTYFCCTDFCLFSFFRGRSVSVCWSQGFRFCTLGWRFSVLESWFCLLHARVVVLFTACWSQDFTSIHMLESELCFCPLGSGFSGLESELCFCSLGSGFSGLESVYFSPESGFCLLLTRVRVLFIAH